MVFLMKHLGEKMQDGPVCIIGDGYGNMASVILETMPDSTVVIVNLNKTLLVDLICLKKGFPDVDYTVARTDAEFEEALSRGIRVIAVGANDTSILRGKDFSLAINIESMMEMDPPVIADYFDILRSGPKESQPFYCCNQAFKRFSGEGTSNFHEYPWRDDDEILVDEVCPWTKITYGNTYPFYHRRRPDLHRLVNLKSDNPSSPDQG